MDLRVEEFSCHLPVATNMLGSGNIRDMDELLPCAVVA